MRKLQFCLTSIMRLTQNAAYTETPSRCATRKPLSGVPKVINPVKTLRLERGQTLSTVAAAVQTDVGNLSRIENCKQKASPELAERLAKHFGYAVTEIQILYPERFAG